MRRSSLLGQLFACSLSLVSPRDFVNHWAVTSTKDVSLPLPTKYNSMLRLPNLPPAAQEEVRSALALLLYYYPEEGYPLPRGNTDQAYLSEVNFSTTPPFLFNMLDEFAAEIVAFSVRRRTPITYHSKVMPNQGKEADRKGAAETCGEDAIACVNRFDFNELQKAEISLTPYFFSQTGAERNPFSVGNDIFFLPRDPVCLQGNCPPLWLEIFKASVLLHEMTHIHRFGQTGFPKSFSIFDIEKAAYTMQVHFMNKIMLHGLPPEMLKDLSQEEKAQFDRYLEHLNRQARENQVINPFFSLLNNFVP